MSYPSQKSRNFFLGKLVPWSLMIQLGVGMVGAWALHELVEVVGLTLQGLLAYTIDHGDQSGVGRSALILLILFAPLCGGALILVLMLSLAFVLASTKDRSDRLLAGGVVCGDV